MTGPLTELEPTRTRAVNALYRDFGADVASDVVTLFNDMAALAQPGN